MINGKVIDLIMIMVFRYFLDGDLDGFVLFIGLNTYFRVYCPFGYVLLLRLSLCLLDWLYWVSFYIVKLISFMVNIWLILNHIGLVTNLIWLVIHHISLLVINIVSLLYFV